MQLDSSKVVYRSLDFVGYPKHRIGSDGSIWSCAKNWKGGKWRRVRLSNVGRYHYVNLTHKGTALNFIVHRLVLEAFVGPSPEGMEACHYDGDGHNNNLSNLRWDTHAANICDQIRHGTTGKGENNPKAKLQPADVREIRRIYAAKELDQWGLAAKYNVDQTTISNIVVRKTWRHVL